MFMHEVYIQPYGLVWWPFNILELTTVQS